MFIYRYIKDNRKQKTKQKATIKPLLANKTINYSFINHNQIQRNNNYLTTKFINQKNKNTIANRRNTIKILFCLFYFLF